VRPASSDSVERLFAEFALLYGTRLADLWRGTDIRSVKERWRVDLAGLSVVDVKRGIAACRTKPWPPTLPEFLLLCCPPAEFESMFVAAQAQVSKRQFGEDVWPSKALYWAAVEFTFSDLRSLSWQTAKARWTRILVAQMTRENELADVPMPVPALPAPGRAKTDALSARSHLASLKAMMKPGASPAP